MKNLISLVFAAILMQSASAFAFVTRIDIQDVKNPQAVKSIVRADEATLFELNGSLVTYAGLPVEAYRLVQKIVDNMGPSAVESVVELNEATGTISVRFQPADAFVPTLLQVVITRSGP